MDFLAPWKRLAGLWETTCLPEEGAALALGGGAVLGAYRRTQSA